MTTPAEIPEESPDPLVRAEKARDMIQKELSRLHAQLKGMENKIASTEAKLEGANEIVAALKPRK